MSSSQQSTFLVSGIQRRSLFGFGKKGNESFVPAPVNPLTEEYLRRKPTNQPKLVRGSLASSSIFEDEEVAGPAQERKPERDAVQSRNPDAMAAALDPQPLNRQRWERNMLIKEIKSRGRISRTIAIKRTERELVLKSHNIKTSVKKLGPLARQITGKSLEDAIVQMRFSKKKAAIEVRNHLEHAKNEAIVKRGMGLGADAPLKQIETKDGKRVNVTNPTAMYVSEAWVGKGDYTKELDHRARGQINIMKNPTTR